MEATALCITLWMTVFLQLCEQKVDADVWIEPSRLQVFEYEPFSLRCVGFDGLTDVNISRRNKAGKETCDGSKWGSLNETNCTITSPYKEDSGDYWCETRGKKSDYVNVIITAGSVILESPVLPVMEGESVTLSCRNKTTTSSILSADFYKDGRLIRSSSTGNITIHRVSKSDEGLYKCSISEGGESPESRLAVRAKETSSTLSPWIFVSVSSMLLLLAVGIHRFYRSYRHRVLLCLSTLTPGPAEHHTVSVEASAVDSGQMLYAVVSKTRKKKGVDQSYPTPVYYTLGPGETQQQEPSVTEDALYSTIQPLKMEI
ncbi:low affinity immunoglobulin gamma Fc region receptor III-like isoform X3 [Gymnodraco acuticeps]|uniref:low affinity immunoglobulin gamma Fc region receptor III-like isoform X3 n=1 Tax=Gymnodraco acuticeps TaxID=8218 RepID=UPI001471856E|nr:low affinity immunoglobulin gamma Fc region receptor III-like isoform X3 [Gymnodraco acuticeps]